MVLSMICLFNDISDKVLDLLSDIKDDYMMSPEFLFKNIIIPLYAMARWLVKRVPFSVAMSGEDSTKAMEQKRSVGHKVRLAKENALSLMISAHIMVDYIKYILSKPTVYDTIDVPYLFDPEDYVMQENLFKICKLCFLPFPNKSNLDSLNKLPPRPQDQLRYALKISNKYVHNVFFRMLPIVFMKAILEEEAMGGENLRSIYDMKFWYVKPKTYHQNPVPSHGKRRRNSYECIILPANLRVTPLMQTFVQSINKDMLAELRSDHYFVALTMAYTNIVISQNDVSLEDGDIIEKIKHAWMKRGHQVRQRRKVDQGRTMMYLSARL